MKQDNSKKILIAIACILLVILCVIIFFLFKKNNKEDKPNNPIIEEKSSFVLYAKELMNFDSSSGVKGYIEYGNAQIGDEIKISNPNGEVINTKIFTIEKEGKTVEKASKGEYVSIIFEDVSIDKIYERTAVSTLDFEAVKTFEAEVYMLTKEEGGSPINFVNSYRPNIEIYSYDKTYLAYTNYSIIEFENSESEITPGSTVHVNVTVPESVVLFEGQEFSMSDGTKIVFTGKVNNLK